MALFPQSELEAEVYYAGLPSTPVLVARTGSTPWEEPTGQFAYAVPKDLRPVGKHSLKEVWEDNLAPKLHTLLDSMKVMWTSTDVVRIGIVEESSAPVILWIGVMPASLSRNDGLNVASKSKELLIEHHITDVDVELRESVVTRSVGPKLLTSTGNFNSDPTGTADIRIPLTATLGLPICAQSTRWSEGTGGFFITEGGDPKRLLLVTARHVVFTPNEDENQLFEHKDGSQPRHHVTLFGDVAFNKYLESIQCEISLKPTTVEYQERRITAASRKDGDTANAKREDAQEKLEQAKEEMKALTALHKDVSTRWATPESRILGHVILSPPINVGVGSEGYTEDWAVIEIDVSKVDESNFNGNAIDLGTQISFYELTRMMNPKRLRDSTSGAFTYPFDCLLTLKDTIPDKEMRHPTALDENDNPSLMVLKRGHTSGLTVGRANDVFSYVRNYYNDNKVQTSKEWAILPFSSRSRAFSEEGDSGSVIVDGLGRIGGLLTSGAGTTPDLDITYATPVNFILNRMKEYGLHEPNINPVLAA